MSKIFCAGNSFVVENKLFRDAEVRLEETPITVAKQYVKHLRSSIITKELIRAAEPSAMYEYLKFYRMSGHLIEMALCVEDLPNDFTLLSTLHLTTEKAYMLLSCGNAKVRDVASRLLRHTSRVHTWALRGRLPPVESVISCERLSDLNENKFTRPLHLNDDKTFATIFKEQTRGLLDGVLGKHVVAAGGSINKLSVHNSLDGSDIDVFIMAKPDDRDALFRNVIGKIEHNAAQLGLKVYYTPKSAVLSLNFSTTNIMIQLVSTDKMSAKDIIYGFDFSHCMIYYDGKNRYANAYWEDTYVNNIVRYNSQHRTTTRQQRLIKLLWQGYSIEDTYHVRHRYGIQQLISALNTQSVDSIIDEMSVSLSLTNNDRENRRLLQLINKGTTKYTTNDAIGVMELNSEFTLYSCAAWSSEKVAALIADQFIVAKSTTQYVSATNGRPLTFMFHECQIYHCDGVNNEIRITCPVAIDFCKYIERVAAVLYIGETTTNSVIQNSSVIMRYKTGVFATKWISARGRNESTIDKPEFSVGNPTYSRLIKFIVKFDDKNYSLVAQAVYV